MRCIRIAALFVSSVLSFSGCNKPPAVQPAQTTQDTKKDFAGFGAATNGGHLRDLISEFGEPIASLLIRGTNELHFMFDTDIAPKAPKGLIGVAVSERDGVVFNVRPITGDRVPFTKAQLAAAKKLSPPDITIQIGEATTRVHPRDLLPTEYNEASKPIRVRRALIVLTDDDARRIKVFTSTNVGQIVRLNIAPEIALEIPIQEMRTNKFEVRFADPGVLIEQILRDRTVEESKLPQSK